MSGDRDIREVRAREVLDCRGLPTVQVDIALDDGSFATADVPSGRSTGAYEAGEMRDGGRRFGGFGVLGAVASVIDVLGPGGRSCRDRQRELDRALIELDGTPTSPARRQRDPRRLPRRRPRRRGVRRACRSTATERQRARPAGAAGQPDQRRQARLRPPRLPGVHRPPDRRADVPRGAARSPRSTSRWARSSRRYGKRPQHWATRVASCRRSPTRARRSACSTWRRDGGPHRPLRLRPRLRRDPLLRRRRPPLPARREAVQPDGSIASTSS